MNRKSITVLIILLVISIIGSLWWGMYFSYNKSEILLRNKTYTEIKKVKTIHEEVWELISQEAQITKEYKDSFDSIYSQIMDKRFGSTRDGLLLNWIKEINPKFSMELYKKLMVSIENLREKFTLQQIKIMDLIKEHKTLCEDPWKKIFIKNTNLIEYVTISSSSQYKRNNKYR